MRSMNASRKSFRGGSRVKQHRLTSTGRAADDRATFGRRAKFRNDPVSRLFRAATRQLALRKPVLLLTFVLLTASGVTALYAGGYAHRGLTAAHRAVDTAAASAGFSDAIVQITGNQHVDPGAVYKAIDLAAGHSVFSVDVLQARNRLRQLDWVADAEVTRHYPDSIAIRLVERIPFGIWNDGARVQVIDRAGKPITYAGRSQFPRLPVFVGEQPKGASDLVEAIALHRAVGARVKAMQRVSDRRWNLILDDGVIVKLPETGWEKELGALEQLIVDKGVLERDIAEIDLRTHGHYTLVLRHSPIQQHKSSRGDAA